MQILLFSAIYTEGHRSKTAVEQKIEKKQKLFLTSLSTSISFLHTKHLKHKKVLSCYTVHLLISYLHIPK